MPSSPYEDHRKGIERILAPVHELKAPPATPAELDRLRMAARHRSTDPLTGHGAKRIRAIGDRLVSAMQAADTELDEDEIKS